MRRKTRPKKQKEEEVAAAVALKKKRGRPRKRPATAQPDKESSKRPRAIKTEYESMPSDPLALDQKGNSIMPDENYSEGIHMSTLQVRALGELVSCKDCGEEVMVGVRPTTKGMISEFTVTCKVCGSSKSTNTPNLIRERKRKKEKKDAVLQKTENINYAHVAAFLDNGLGYSGLRHYCRYLNARCLNEATFIVYARQVIADVVVETEDFLQQNARIIRKAFETQLDTDYLVDLTVSYTTTYHQWGSDFCLVAGAVIELQTGLVIDYDVANMYCHVCKINAKKIVSMTPSEMTEWFNKHQDTCEIREWCDEIDQDTDDGVKEIDPKYLEAFIAKKLWARSVEKFGFRYTTLIHESDERIHGEILKSSPYGDIPVLIDGVTNCFSRRKSEHARTSFQNKLKAKCPRERVQTKDRIMYVYSMSIPEYNKFAIGSNIKLRELVKRIDIEENPNSALASYVSEVMPTYHTSHKNYAEEEDNDAMMEEEEGGEEDSDEEEVDEEEEDEDEESVVQVSQIEVLEDEEEEIIPVNPEEAMDDGSSKDVKPITKKTVEPKKEANETPRKEKKITSPQSKASSKEILIVTEKDKAEAVIENPFENGEDESDDPQASSNDGAVKPFRVDFDED